MENNSRESVIERIKKLFALADNNPNQNEAIAAALKAQHLMARFDIDIEECEECGEEEQLVEEIEVEEIKAHRDVIESMARVGDCIAVTLIFAMALFIFFRLGNSLIYFLATT